MTEDQGDEERECVDRELVEDTENPEELTYLFMEDSLHQEARNLAARKLLDRWKQGFTTVTMLQLLCYVGDHAVEPYKTEANEFIRSKI